MRALNVVLLLWLVSLQAGCAQMQTPPAETPQDQVSPTQTPQAQPPQALTTPPPPQTARQALIEMFIAAKPGALEKHLPDITRKTLMSGGDPMKSDVLREFVTFSAGFTANQKHFETFDDGPLLLSMEPVHGGEKLEIAVERDDLLGDADEIDLSIRVYKEGQLQSLPVVPRFSFTMKQENDVWKLNELAVTLRMPLANEEYLKGLKKKQEEDAENSAIAAVRTLNTAEVSYAATYTDRGFTCSLSELGGQAETPAPEHAMLIDGTLAGGEKGGYRFSISGCDARPAAKYEVTAVPSDADSGLRTFCSDESAVLKFAADGKAATCANGGTPLQ